MKPAVKLPRFLSLIFDYIPLDRDQLLMLLIAGNEFMLGLDTYLAHRISGTIVFREWIPIMFGPAAGTILLIAGLLARKQENIACGLASLALLGSFLVGLLGTWFHFQYAYRGGAPPGHRISISILIWAPPALGPLAFCLAAWLGLSAVWKEVPLDSGELELFRTWRVQLPFSKTKAYFMIVSLGIMIAVISSVLDHARHGFSKPWMWIAAAIGVFAALVSFFMAATDDPHQFDTGIYTVSMLLLLILGPIGTGYHILANLTAGREIVLERFIRGAPVLAPFLFSNMGVMGLVILAPRSASRS